jgi:hypothetical protein
MDYQDVRDGRTRPHMPQLIVPYVVYWYSIQ